jgi:DNA invertase Pin-like site-specific DNA recombinase
VKGKTRLAAALKEARASKCPLVVSRLDRLSRNVHFISGLMEHKVHFLVAAFGQVVDNFMLHIYASVAEQERKMISERIKGALAARKLRGGKFGFELMSKTRRMRITQLGHVALQRAAIERAEAYRLQIEWAFGQTSRYGSGRPISYQAAADKLNERGIPSPFGKSWAGGQDTQGASDCIHRLEPCRARKLWIGFVKPSRKIRTSLRTICVTSPALTIQSE